MTFADISSFAMNEEVQNTLLENLCQMYASTATFRNINQMFAVYCILSKVNDTFIVWPTGSGKSLTYLLPSYVESTRDGKGVTVVITPLRELDHQIIANCEKFNIPCRKYSNIGEGLPEKGVLVIGLNESDTGDVHILLKG